ncbi:hypothetical protein J1N35_031322 [Gossypium stocksii]|uniref:Zinc finger C3HC4 RING-type domain-containing protein n=1 Tax=Gossypium stocksii TaxID=47602 RepID=A0A9D3V1P3_9ROSI|nr:hypothetical protein J1N35_031322 [Gossypium stocksii]
MFTSNPCSHSFCNDCTGKYVEAKIQENIAMVKCPDVNCNAALEPQFCRSIVLVQVFDQWKNALCELLVLSRRGFTALSRIALPWSHGMPESRAASSEIWGRRETEGRYYGDGVG